MKKDGIKSWADLYVLLRESYESFRYCKEDQRMSENCCCNKEKKEFCVVYTIEGEERHMVIIAKDELDAVHQVHNAMQIIASLFGLDTCFGINRVYQEC